MTQVTLKFMPQWSKFKSLLFTLVLVLLSHVSFGQSTSWTGSTDTSWATVANWTAGIPTSVKDAIIGDGNFTGTFQPTIGAASVCKSLTVGSVKASTLT